MNLCIEPRKIDIDPAGIGPFVFVIINKRVSRDLETVGAKAVIQPVGLGRHIDPEITFWFWCKHFILIIAAGRK